MNEIIASTVPELFKPYSEGSLPELLNKLKENTYIAELGILPQCASPSIQQVCYKLTLTCIGIQNIAQDSKILSMKYFSLSLCVSKPFDSIESLSIALYTNGLAE